MKSAFRIERPGDVDCTLSVTMSLRKWAELAEQLPSNYPSWEITAAIQGMVSKAKIEFGYEPEREKESEP